MRIVIDPYDVMVIQSNIRNVFRDGTSGPDRAAIKENLENALHMITEESQPSGHLHQR